MLVLTTNSELNSFLESLKKDKKARARTNYGSFTSRAHIFDRKSF